MPNTADGTPCIAFVVPCYNESEVLPVTIPAMTRVIDTMVAAGQCANESFILFVDDGSRDATMELIERASTVRPDRVRGLCLAHNAGHQFAVLAGLEYAAGQACDAVISIDADLQDDISVIPAMVDKYREGAEVVFGVRDRRDTDTAFKKYTAIGYYRLMRLMGVDIVPNHADFRLLSARSLAGLLQFREYHLFLRGIAPLLHRRTAVVSYHRAARVSGETSYTLGRMLSLAWSGITSFSIMPLRIISVLGALIFLLSAVAFLYAMAGALTEHVVPGWASITVPLYALGGMVMLSIGIVGEYIGKIYIEVKGRPRFLVDHIVVAGKSRTTAESHGKRSGEV